MSYSVILWNYCRDALPEKTGNYIVVTERGEVTTLPYSKNHKLFNTRDEADNNIASQTCISCICWSKYPDSLNELIDDYKAEMYRQKVKEEENNGESVQSDQD